MSQINIIAGPPGIGKSTRGFDYIDKSLDILNEDEMRFKYKDKGFVDYNEYSIHRVRDIIRSKLIKNEDFALELNLGFPHQYEYVLSAKNFRKENTLNVVLLFTDDVQFCQDRAKIRYESGLHLVKPEIITQMFDNTLPLFKGNFDSIDNALIVHVDSDEQNPMRLIAHYSKAQGELKIFENGPDWFALDLKPFIEQQMKLTKYEGPKVDPWSLNDINEEYKSKRGR